MPVTVYPRSELRGEWFHASLKPAFNGISITSIGSVNNFYCFENREEVINTISCLLTKLQQDNAQLAQSGSATNRLERLKSLLDAGVLTQDEFDTKKRQILGL